MTTLAPVRYADKDNSTFFDVAGLLIAMHFRVTQRKRWLVPRTVDP